VQEIRCDDEHGRISAGKLDLERLGQPAEILIGISTCTVNVNDRTSDLLTHNPTLPSPAVGGGAGGGFEILPICGGLVVVVVVCEILHIKDSDACAQRGAQAHPTYMHHTSPRFRLSVATWALVNRVETIFLHLLEENCLI